MKTKSTLAYAAQTPQKQLTKLWASACATCLLAVSAHAAPVPGYVSPVAQSTTPEYADDTRGVYVPAHNQFRMKSQQELANWQTAQAQTSHAPARGSRAYEQKLNSISSGVSDFDQELNRIAQDPGLLKGGQASADANLYMNDTRMAQAAPQKRLMDYPSLSNSIVPQEYRGQGTQPRAPQPAQAPYNMAPQSDGGVQIATGQMKAPTLGRKINMQNSLVRLQEERISVRRALQRMMDQIGGGEWAIVWDLDEQNIGLPDMEVSLYAEEPFMSVLNAMLARLQTRSGQPLRVIRYDRTSRLVITDRAGGAPRDVAGVNGTAKTGGDLAITENVLKEAMVTLHYDEVPLVDALENIVHQAGKGQWRLRMYAGLDQVLKPAHVEEPFNIAIVRLLKIFGLKYEIFPGGKLIVVTHTNKFGFRGVQ